jgi:hypothetical protein
LYALSRQTREDRQSAIMRLLECDLNQKSARLTPTVPFSITRDNEPWFIYGVSFYCWILAYKIFQLTFNFRSSAISGTTTFATWYPTSGKTR